jgi:hypothetical protein
MAQKSKKPEQLATSEGQGGMPAVELEELINTRAYYLYVERGGSGGGNELADWFEAERQVLAELSPRADGSATEKAKKSPGERAATPAKTRKASSTARPRKSKEDSVG